MELLYNYYKNNGSSVPGASPAHCFSSHLTKFIGELPIVHYLTDNASIPSGVRYFIKQTSGMIKYYGVEKNIKPLDCNFVRSHSFYGLCGDNYFLSRLMNREGNKLWFDLPPHVLFDQKATLVLPFWEKTRVFFPDRIRDIILYSTPLVKDGIELDTGERVSIECFSKMPQSQRNYYLKYAGTDVSINWGSKAIYRLSNYGSEQCQALLNLCLQGYQKGKIWLLQKEKSEKRDVPYWERGSKSLLQSKALNTKYSAFYGPSGLIGMLASYRRHFKVHGQPETVLTLIATA